MPTRRKGTPPPQRRGFVPQRRAVTAAKAKLAAKRADTTASARSKGAQKGAVTKAKKKLQEARATGTKRMKRLGVAFKPGKAKKPAATAAKPQGSGRKPNERARRLKELVNRKGTVAGDRFESGQSVQTMSMAELRRAVRQYAKQLKIKNKKTFNFMISLGGGVTKVNENGTQVGRTPKTRGDWEKIYNALIGVQKSDRGRKERPGIINGIDIQKHFRPWAVFGLNAKTATRDDVNSAFRKLAIKNHPDHGGRAKDLEQLKLMRDSVLAMMPRPKPPKAARAKGGKAGKGKGKAAAAAAAAMPRGPLLLPAAKDAAPTKPTRKPRRKRS